MATRRAATKKTRIVLPLEELDSAVMLLGELYAEVKGGPAPPPWPDDGAHKSWNYYWGELKRRRLITAPTNKQISAGNAPPARITPKGIAEFERIRAMPQFETMLARWEAYCTACRQAEERADASRAKKTPKTNG